MNERKREELIETLMRMDRAEQRLRDALKTIEERREVVESNLKKSFKKS